jgi:hypothetical protein
MVSRPDWIELRRIKKLIPRGGIEHITHAGNSRGLWSRDQIIDWIEQGSYQFFTCVNDRAEPVLVRRELGWPAYLCTQLGGMWTEDLLKLEIADDERAPIREPESPPFIVSGALSSPPSP